MVVAARRAPRVMEVARGRAPLDPPTVEWVKTAAVVVAGMATPMGAMTAMGAMPTAGAPRHAPAARPRSTLTQSGPHSAKRRQTR